MLLFKKLEDCLFLLLKILIITLPRVNITNYNVLIDGRKLYDQIRKYNQIRKIATGQWDDYTTGCLLDYQYFKDHYQLIAVDLSKQK